MNKFRFPYILQTFLNVIVPYHLGWNQTSLRTSRFGFNDIKAILKLNAASVNQLISIQPNNMKFYLAVSALLVCVGCALAVIILIVLSSFCTFNATIHFYLEPLQ